MYPWAFGSTQFRLISVACTAQTRVGTRAGQTQVDGSEGLKGQAILGGTSMRSFLG